MANSLIRCWTFWRSKTVMVTLMWFQRNPLPVDWQAQSDIITNFE